MRQFVVLLCFVLAACSDSSGSDPSLAGDWVGSFSDGGGTYTLTLDIQQQGQTITASGTGTYTASPNSFVVNATGTYVHPDVTLLFGSTGTYNGTRSGSSIAGTLTSGSSAYPLTFTRQ